MDVERPRPSPVLDLTRPGGVEVELEVSEAAEVLMSICAVADRDDHDTFDLGAEWLTARLETVPDDLRATAEELLLGSHKIAAHLLGIVVETPQPRTFAAFMERLAATDPVELKLHLFGHYGNVVAHLSGPDVMRRAALGDADARREFLDSLAEFGDKHALVERVLDLDGDELKARFLDLLPRWHETVFLPVEPEWRAAAERDAEAKRKLAQRHTPEQLVELATRGYQYAPPPGIRRLVLFPSWFMRPWVILWEHRSTKIFCYPIAAEEPGASPAEVARVYKALGDEGRLRVLRRLADGPLTLSEAAAELGVAKSTAHHHLAILRHAGFVTIRDEDEKVYSLRADLPPAGELLAGYLSRSSATTA